MGKLTHAVALAPGPTSADGIDFMKLGHITLKKGEDRRIRAGHLWVFSNEVDAARTPLTGFEPGEPVEIRDSGGRSLGTGYVNPHSLICARLVSRRAGVPMGAALLRERVQQALTLRQRLFAAPFYRLVYGESDGLPGLVVDCFGEVLVVQLNTAGMERLRDEVTGVLEEVIRPGGILLRNDGPARELEGLESYVEVAAGTVPEQVVIEENGARFAVPLRTGQKTGWFYDHRLNRERAQRYAPGARVLDVFSYLGGWGIQALVAGARRAVCVDASAAALQAAQQSAELNGVAGRIETVQGDAFEVLRQLAAARQRYDLVVLDPPAFIKRKKDAKQGEQAYRRLNQLALQLVVGGGVLVSASCSYHLPRSGLRDALLRASRTAGRELQILEQGHQAPDHPVHPAIPETDYLKVFLARAVD
jgi:23S rRNA (cytosine1962-C5)-methyltransferase